jgi:transposase-like protein
MKQTPPNGTAEQHVREIRRKTRKQYSSEEKIRIVISGLRGEHSIAELCRPEGIAENLCYVWSKEFDNGRRNYELHGKPIFAPVDSLRRPDSEALRWRNEHAFRG